MISEHKISTYKDGYQNIEYCLKCGKEDLQLSEDCEPNRFTTSHERMAKYLDLGPKVGWEPYISILDHLIDFEKRYGEKRLLEEIRKMHKYP